MEHALGQAGGLHRSLEASSGPQVDAFGGEARGLAEFEARHLFKGIDQCAERGEVLVGSDGAVAGELGVHDCDDQTKARA